MNIEKTAPEAIQGKLDPVGEGGFSFACHPGVSCFTECCRELRLLLTPYDILRLKKRLGLGAREFIDQYCDEVYDDKRHLPMIHLKMREDERRTCPFVSPEGCGVYEDRPSACRIYPIARASRVHPVSGSVMENFFVLREEHCRGFEEPRHWSVEQWVEDQGLDAYAGVNDRWMAVMTHPRLVRGNPPSPQQQQMFYLASYNLERFRDFIFGSRFLTAFDLPEEELDAIRESDDALLELAIKWLRFSLCGEKTLTVRQAAAE